jgi:diamine N-acetyltransferase
MNFTVRLAEISDAEKLAFLASETFYETFAHSCTPEDMALHLSSTYSPTLAAQEIADPSHVHWLVCDADEPIAYARIRWANEPNELLDRKAMEIERLYVRSAYQGHKLGHLLMKRCLELAENKDCELVYLGVWEHNYKAQEFYKKHGFEPFGSHVFMVGYDPQTDIWMRKELKTNK